LIPLAHQAKYRINPNHATTIEQNIDKLLVTRFMHPVEEATWLSSIVVVLKKIGKFKIFVNCIKLNVTTKKYPYPFSLNTNEVLNIVIRHDAYSFLDGYSKYH
jgi:hypothetical protein